ncbi:choice-of-anchor I family protein [Orrella sp. JC864]|uniref:choice-of-anchor I family protein n=1 Tax=Orrella sp. JC864 TaxID=3120298 RepID=UPI00300B45A8
MTPERRFRLNACARAIAACSLALALAACGSSDDDDDAPAPAPEVPAEPSPPEPERTPDSLKLSLLGRFETGQFDVSAAEIPAFDPATRRAFVVNALAGAVDVLDLSDPAKPVRVGGLDASAIAAGAEVNSIAVQDGLIALAIQAANKTDNGYVGLYRADTLEPIAHVGVGALPDNLVFTPDGKTVLVANEGEPSDDYQIDPEGSISIIDVSDPARPTVRTAGFSAWNGQEQALRDKGVRLFGPNAAGTGLASAAQDLEPEYIAVSPDGATAWVTLQENNALAKLDIASATVTDILPLGYKDHGQPGNGIDASDDPAELDIRPRPGVYGMYMPDAIAAYTAGGKTYLATANEGDARAWGEDDPAYWAGDRSKGFVEEFRVKHLVHNSGFARRRGDDLAPQLDMLATRAILNPEVFGYCGANTVANGGTTTSGACRDDAELGRLQVTWTLGYRTNADGSPVYFNASGAEDPAGSILMYDRLYAFGARSFSIWDEDGKLVWDSGDQFERYLASDECRVGPQRDIACKTYFNSGHNEGNAFDSRSDAKGPEPEGIELGRIGEKTFAFIGLERMGGIMVYDVTDPQAPVFVDYYNSRVDWSTRDTASVAATAGDLGPEGLKFVPASQSPNGQALLIVGNEVSGTTAIYNVEQLFAQAAH